ncbi:hypothetical protein DL93DRAFT_2085367 [Clavulina sp. PMI_390]|nr:hypothetical protein DL93DRAFT_2085367 [Clavulina sp. PMI_390]
MSNPAGVSQSARRWGSASAFLHQGIPRLFTPSAAPPPQYSTSSDTTTPDLGALSLCNDDHKTSHHYFYYRLFQDGVPITSRNKFPIAGSSNHNQEFIGRILPENIPPPRSVKTLKHHIAKSEGFAANDIQDIYLPDCDTAIEETARLDRSFNAPGTDAGAPMEVIIREGVPRTLNSVSSRGGQLYDPADWIVKEDGSAVPRVDSAKPWLLASASLPHPWKRGRVRGYKSIWVQNLEKPDGKWHPSPIPEDALIYVENDSNKLLPLTSSDRGLVPCYRCIYVAEKLIGGIPVDNVYEDF